MKKTFFSFPPFLRLWAGLFSTRKSSDGIAEGALRLSVDNLPDVVNNQDTNMTLHSLTDYDEQALRVTFVNGSFVGDDIFMNGAPIYWGGNDEFKMWCDSDNIMKIAYLEAGSYEVIVGFPNFGEAWIQEPYGLPLHIGKQSIYLGLYNKWQLKTDALSECLQFNVDAGSSYDKMLGYDSGVLADPETVAGEEVSVGTGAIYFGEDNNYRMFVDVDGKLTLAQKEFSNINQYTKVCFKIGI